MASIELHGVRVNRGGGAVLRGIDLSVADGELLGLVGVTGSGKSTLLRTIAGLEPVADGQVLVGDVDVTRAPADERGVSFVAQEAALYRHRSVRRNIAFPLEIGHEESVRIRERVVATAQALRIAALLDRAPSELSAGEARIVQIARAIVRTPEVLLLDEPFASVDTGRATALRREVSFLRRGYGITTVVATNDTHEAMACDRIAVVEAGRIGQCDTPMEVYSHPRTMSAAVLTGDADVIDVEVVRDAGGNGTWLEHSELRVHSWRPALAEHAGRRVQLVVRPEWWELDEHSTTRLAVGGSLHDRAAPSWWCRVGERRVRIAPTAATSVDVSPGAVIGLRLTHFVLLDPRDGFPLRLE